MVGDQFPLLFALGCGGFFVLCLAAIGIFLIMFSLRSRRKAEASQGWPSVPGQVTAAVIKRSVSTDDDGHTQVSYYPAVEYAYQVGEQSYLGKRLAFGGVMAYKSEARAATVLQRYPAGAQVTVYYDPEKPADAVLERTAGGFKWGLAVGVVCLLLGVCIACPLLIGIIRNLPVR